MQEITKLIKHVINARSISNYKHDFSLNETETNYRFDINVTISNNFKQGKKQSIVHIFQVFIHFHTKQKRLGEK